MNRYLALGCLGIGLMVSPLLGALRDSQGAVPTNPKIGVIDIQETLEKTPAGKRANEQFEKGRKAKQEDLDKRQKDLQRAAAELDKQAAVLKPDILATKKQELEKKFVELQQHFVKLERDLAQERTKLIQDLLKQAEPKIAAIAKAEGVSLILDHQATVWIDPAVDLTAALNKQMN